MSQDDMHVVMYKILSYVYDCNKRGVEPRPFAISHDSELLGIPYGYWSCVMREIHDKGLMRGIQCSDIDATVLVTCPTITLAGVEFLQENSMMRKAYNFLKDAKALMPFMS